MKQVIFLDKDGTLVPDVPYNVDPQKITLMAGAVQGLRRLIEAGYRLVVVSNQSGVARGFFRETDLKGVEARLREFIKTEVGADLDGFYYCPHHPDGTVPEYTIECDCRKPQPGMLLKASKDLNIDLERSWMIGDILNDIEAGQRAGCRTILIANGNETEWKRGAFRMPDFLAANLDEAARIVITNPYPEPDARSADAPPSYR